MACRVLELRATNRAALSSTGQDVIEEAARQLHRDVEEASFALVFTVTKVRRLLLFVAVETAADLYQED